MGLDNTIDTGMLRERRRAAAPAARKRFHRKAKTLEEAGFIPAEHYK